MAGQADDCGRRRRGYRRVGYFRPRFGLVHGWTRSPPATALPGSSPTISINGTRYINGGVRSPESADLASGYANVVVSSPFGGRSGTLPEGQFEGLRRPLEWGMDLEGQVEALRKQGSRVEVITPDANSRAAMGSNQMDPTTRIPSARAGFVQGTQEATRVTIV